MPECDVLIYREDDGSVPLRDWLDALPAEVRVRCLERLERLHERGHELRRPLADYLGAGIYELRIKFYRVNYRMLDFFHGRTAAVVAHGFSKEKRVPPREIKRAVSRMEKFQIDPEAHTFTPEP